MKREIILIIISIGLLSLQSLMAQEFDGYALYNRSNNPTTYLIDKDGDIAHTWSNQDNCNYTVLLMDSGNIMRGAVNQGNAINGAAVGGKVQEIDPEGNIVWEFVYSSQDYVSHHDICLMPDGNVMLIAWEVKTISELSALGYTGNSSVLYPTHFIEVSQNGTGGEIVWEWHIWDHLIQDVDPTLPNYGVISEHPELMDINVPSSGFSGGPGGPPGGGGDWFHVNGIDYSEELDLITFSSRFLSEIFVIDHSTTTEEAAGHTGGKFGMGGDLLYRWGNPSNYNTPGDRMIDGPVHDTRWVPNDGRPRAGFIQFFNNEGRGSGSLIDAIDPPFNENGDGFIREEGKAFGPEIPNFTRECLDFAGGQSSSYSLPNGNLYVNMSGEYMYEEDIDGNLVWQYNAGPQKGFRFVCEHPGIQRLIQDGYVEDKCLLNSTLDIESSTLSIIPNPSNGIFEIQGIDVTEVQQLAVLNSIGQVQGIYDSTKIDLSSYQNGVYIILIDKVNQESVSTRVSIVK